MMKDSGAQIVAKCLKNLKNIACIIYTLIQSMSQHLVLFFSLSSKMAEDNNHGKVSPQITGKEDLLNALERSKKRNASALGTPKVD